MKLYTVTYTYEMEDGEGMIEMLQALRENGDDPDEMTVFDGFAHVTFKTDEEGIGHGNQDNQNRRR